MISNYLYFPVVHRKGELSQNLIPLMIFSFFSALWFRSGLCDSVAIIEGYYLKFCSKRLCISDIYLSLAWFSLLFFCLFLLGLHLVCRQIWFAVLLVCLLDKDTKSGSYFQISQLCFCVICSREVLHFINIFLHLSGLAARYFFCQKLFSVFLAYLHLHQQTHKQVNRLRQNDCYDGFN